MAKKKKETIGIIKGKGLLKKSAPKADIPFKKGKYKKAIEYIEQFFKP